MTDKQPTTTVRKPRRPKAPRVLVVIDEKMIEDSKQRDSSHCMIATAVQEARSDARAVSVDLQTIRFSLPETGLRYTYLTPRKAQVALIEFDQGETPEPFTFELKGGMVTLMARRRKPNVPPQPRSAKQQAAAKAIGGWPQLAKGDQPGSAVRRVGGRTPPSTPFARRREFGLRALRH